MIDYALSDVYRLFVDGLTIGGLLSALPFLLGYVINWLVQLVRK